MHSQHDRIEVFDGGAAPHEPQLTATDAHGVLYLGLACASSALGLGLSMQQSTAAWFLGQLVLGVSLTQWFVLLHEAGHRSLFRTRALNTLAGHLAGFFALIPFECWRRVHALHHVWTGWQDMDPTTAALSPKARPGWQCKVVDFAWRSYLPLFSVLYRIANYWHWPRLKALFTEPAQRRALALNAVALVCAYAYLLYAFDPASLIRLTGLALLVALITQDPLLLSQHTHLPQRLSGGRKVMPLSPIEQLPCTRSLIFPRWIARWVLVGFNAHELHHRYPNVPGYRLIGLDQLTANSVHWWQWLAAAKRLPGSVFLFQTRDHTGFPY